MTLENLTNVKKHFIKNIAKFFRSPINKFIVKRNNFTETPILRDTDKPELKIVDIKLRVGLKLHSS